MARKQKQIRNNFLQSNNTTSSKGKAHDPLLNQRVDSRKDYSVEELMGIGAKELVMRNLCSIIPIESLKNGIDIELEDEVKKKEFEDAIYNLNVKSKMQQALIDANILGDAGLRILSSGLSSNPITNYNGISLVNYNSTEVYDFERDLDFNSPGYLQVKYCNFLDPNSTGKYIKYHSDRFINIQPLPLITKSKGKYQNDIKNKGYAMLNALQDIRTLLDSTSWSIGQIIYQMTMKILKGNVPDKENRDKLQEQLLEQEFNTKSLVILGTDDDLSNLPNNFPSGLKDGLDYIYNIISLITKIPKSKIFGNQAGALSGSEQDDLNFRDSVVNYQDSVVYPALKEVLDVIAMSLGIEKYSFKINKPFSITETQQIANDKVEAETNKLEAETNSIRVTSLQTLQKTGLLTNVDQLNKVIAEGKTALDLLKELD